MVSHTDCVEKTSISSALHKLGVIQTNPKDLHLYLPKTQKVNLVKMKLKLREYRFMSL